ncbi:MAG TPA: helix-turn-helix transcriptional regulator [Archangium sp.]|nr:helix-turn-helix transcriptional regulator [Archangium sp.]
MGTSTRSQQPQRATAFGTLLRDWRLNRRMTQEKLALDAEVSTRHISYIETGRAQPSREMVLLLCSVLEVPLRERNVLLVSAGFAPIYGETDYAAPEMAPVRQAIDILLERHEPYGAIVVDSAWNVRRANRGAKRLFSTFVPTQQSRLLVNNMLRLLLDPEGLREGLDNWEEVALAALERTHREAIAEGPQGPAARILSEVLALPGVPRHFHQPRIGTPLSLVVPLHLRRGALSVRLFTMITTLGTPADVTAQELRVETWFPADEASAEWCRAC